MFLLSGRELSVICIPDGSAKKFLLHLKYTTRIERILLGKWVKNRYLRIVPYFEEVPASVAVISDSNMRFQGKLMEMEAMD